MFPYNFNKLMYNIGWHTFRGSSTEGGREGRREGRREGGREGGTEGNLFRSTMNIVPHL